MKKIGILTLYYKNYNYGGLLQAFALRQVVENIGYDCEQISFIRNKDGKILRILKEMFKSKEVISNIVSVRLNILYNKIIRGYDGSDKATYALFDKFINEIPHSAVVDKEGACILSKGYNAIIVGSDQVWNPVYTNDEYLLSFADSKITKKISYAASIRINKFTKSDADTFKRCLADFSKISVREENAKKLLCSIGLKQNIDVLPDPSFLLSKEEWQRIITPVSLPYKYIFAYLVRNKKSIANLREYAKKTGTKIVLVSDPGFYVEEDGIVVKYNGGIGPKEFVSLINDAEFVVANSFHGTAFSIILNKQFAVYGDINVDDRKGTVLRSYGIEDRIIPFDYDFSKPFNTINFDQVNEILAEKRMNAINWLKNALSNK